MSQHQFEQIAERLKGLREALDMSVDEFAASCHIPLEEYTQYEAGDKDLTLSLLRSIAEKYNVDVSTLLFADEPKMKSYFVTRKGKGQGVERVSAYSYRTLAGGFNNRKADIFEVTIEPKEDTSELHQSRHEGQEFGLVLEGRMLMHISGKNIVLDEGDSIYFDSSLPHGMKALDGKRVRFIAIIL